MSRCDNIKGGEKDMKEYIFAAGIIALAPILADMPSLL